MISNLPIEICDPSILFRKTTIHVLITTNMTPTNIFINPKNTGPLMPPKKITFIHINGMIKHDKGIGVRQSFVPTMGLMG